MPIGTKSSENLISFETQHSQRVFAAAIHVSSVFWPLLGPLVGWFVFRNQPFARAHAKQALLETIVLNVLVFLLFVASTIYTVSRIVHFVDTGWQDFSWQEFLLRFVVGWVFLFLLEAVNTLVSVRQAWSAWKGHWPRSNQKADGSNV